VSIIFVQNRSHALRIEEKSAQDHGAAAYDGSPPTNCRLRDAEMGFCAARIRLITISPSLGAIGRAGGEVDDGCFSSVLDFRRKADFTELDPPWKPDSFPIATNHELGCFEIIGAETEIRIRERMFSRAFVGRC
jgi:hypothetical protein